MSDHENVSTSEPIYKAAATVGAAVTALLGLIGGAVSLGVLTTEQGAALYSAGEALVAAIPQLGAALVVIVGLVTGIGASFATAWQARKSTVPTDSEVFRVTPVTGGPVP